MPRVTDLASDTDDVGLVGWQVCVALTTGKMSIL
jgi:hypothetical protein